MLSFRYFAANAVVFNAYFREVIWIVEITPINNNWLRKRYLNGSKSGDRTSSFGADDEAIDPRAPSFLCLSLSFALTDLHGLNYAVAARPNVLLTGRFIVLGFPIRRLFSRYHRAELGQFVLLTLIGVMNGGKN